MAAELKYSITLDYSKGSVAYKNQSSRNSITVSGTNLVSGTQSIGTSVESLAKGDIGTVGFVLVKNLDATNYVELSQDAGTGYFGKLSPGEEAALPVSASNIHARANTAACVVQYTLIEE